MPFASLSDLNKDDDRGTESYAGGHQSGMGVLNPGDEGPRSLDLTLWQNGFTVNNSPLIPLDENLMRKFKADIKEGKVPAMVQKALPKGMSGQVEVHLEDRSEQPFDPSAAPAPPAATSAPAPTATSSMFAGAGQTLGGAPAGPSTAAAASDAANAKLDESKPKTTIRIRFPDGRQQAVVFNEDQLVADLQAVIIEAMGGQAVTIRGGFPPKPITDFSPTLKAAGLCQSAVTVAAA